jgi:CubicO group peptidase (beta-lactamase class C family)
MKTAVISCRITAYAPCPARCKCPKRGLWKGVSSKASLLAFALLTSCNAHQGQPADAAKEIASLMSALHERGQFNGEVLVAREGKVIYRNAFGKANFTTGAELTPDTPSDIGSVTKQFTAMAIMLLKERNQLGYDDAVSKYIPEFSHSAHFNKITLRQLLTHTSGIPDYGDLDIDDSALDQKGLIAMLLKKESALAEPGQEYRYSNPGYALLGIVVQRASGTNFGAFLQNEIFTPLGMSNTFVYDNPAKKSARAAVGYGQFGQTDEGRPTAIPGDGGIYSTADDLFKWDQALYTEKLVSRADLGQAFTPGKVRAGISTYGFGWHISRKYLLFGDKYVWHQGNHAGFRAFIGRRLADRITVILLTNKGNSKRQDINAAIQSILEGRPYVLPKRSGAERLYHAIRESGIQAALQVYDALRNGNDYDVGESELNLLGYQLLYGDKRAGDAIVIFKLNTTEHPKSSNAFDSLGEAYRRNGQRDLAIESYRAAIKLDPSNGHAAAALKELK